MSIVIYTDGACSGNPGPGGWAWAVAPTGEPSGFGHEPQTTNQRMELLAVINALRTYSWEPLIELVNSRDDISFTWVKAHNGDPMNELVDQLAVAASLSAD